MKRTLLEIVQSVMNDMDSGDQIKLFIATDQTANVTITDLTFQMLFLRAN